MIKKTLTLVIVSTITVNACVCAPQINIIFNKINKKINVDILPKITTELANATLKANQSRKNKLLDKDKLSKWLDKEKNIHFNMLKIADSLRKDVKIMELSSK